MRFSLPVLQKSERRWAGEYLKSERRWAGESSVSIEYFVESIGKVYSRARLSLRLSLRIVRSPYGLG